MIRRAIAIFLLSVSAAWAQQTTVLPQATLPLTGAELAYVVQGGQSKQAPVSAFGNSGAKPLTVTDGTHSANSTGTLSFTSGCAVTAAANSVAQVACTGAIQTITDGTNTFAAAAILKFPTATVSNPTPGTVSVAFTASATSIAVGTTTVSGGTSGYFLTNGATLGNVGSSGSGLVVLNTAPSIAGLTVTSAFTATGLVTNADLVNAATTVNGQTCTLGSTCTAGAAAGTLTGTTLASNVVTSALTSAAGGSFAALAFLANAPAATLTGTALNAAITTAPGLTTVAAGTIGTAAIVNTGPSGSVLCVLNANCTFGGIDTFLNNNIRIVGSSTGYLSLNNLDASSTNYQWNFPAANASPLWYASASPPVNGQCPTMTGVLGQVSFGSSCGSGGSALSVSDPFGNTVAPTNFLTLAGGVLSGTTPSATWSPTTISRTVTGTGGTCPGSGTPGATVNVLCPQDMGNIVILNGSSLPFTIGAISSTLLASGQQTTIVNNAATAATITSTPAILGYPTSGSGPYTLTLPALQGGTAAALGLTSNGTSLQNTFGIPPSLVINSVAGQPFSGGYHYTSDNLGTVTTGTVNIDCGHTLQYVTNNGFTGLSLANFDSDCYLLVTNGASAGVIAPAGFSVSANTGDPIDTVSGHSFTWHLQQINGVQSYQIAAHQGVSGAFGFLAATQWGTTQTGTSSAINTASPAAQIMIVAVAYQTAGGGAVAISDLAGNTWAPYTNYLGAGSQNNIRMWSCGIPPAAACATSSVETVTVTGSAVIDFNAGVMAFSAPSGYAADGSVVGNTAGVAPNSQPGSITPAGAGDLFVTAVTNTDGSGTITATINSGFTQPFGFAAFDAAAGGLQGFGMGYLISSGSSAQNPTWAFGTGTSPSPATMVAIKP